MITQHTPRRYSPENPPPLRREGESVEDYRVRCGWDAPQSPTPVLDSIEQDAERFRYFVSDPETGRHLLLLLSHGKGDAAALRRMIDRIQASKAAATVKATGSAS